MQSTLRHASPILFVVVGLLSHPALADTPKASYAVVVSKAASADPQWKEVVDALVKKHQAEVVAYDGRVSESLGRLRELFPRYACFVATPKEVTREFVGEVHRLTRRFDDDPYTDTIWGILTGYDAANALRIAQCVEPLTIERVASATEVELTRCKEGVWYCELQKNRMVRKEPGKEPEPLKGPDDTTKALVDALNEYKAQCFITSGHASERDWQIGYTYRNGTFRCEGGRVFGLDTKGQKHFVKSDNPKVYMPVGNCLIGHIDRQDCMALAYLNSAGVMQMFGYTVPSWYGYAGWGCLDYFVEQPGRYTFAEAFFANHEALLHRLESAKNDKGLLYDRDTVAFYGDPAWEARMAPGKLNWEQTLTEKGGVYTFEVKPNEGEKTFDPVNRNGSQRGGRPIFQWLPRRIKNIVLIQGEDLHPVIADNFLLVPNPGKCDPKQAYRVVFRAESVGG